MKLFGKPKTAGIAQAAPVRARWMPSAFGITALAVVVLFGSRAAGQSAAPDTAGQQADATCQTPWEKQDAVSFSAKLPWAFYRAKSGEEPQSAYGLGFESSASFGAVSLTLKAEASKENTRNEPRLESAYGTVSYSFGDSAQNSVSTWVYGDRYYENYVATPSVGVKLSDVFIGAEVNKGAWAVYSTVSVGSWTPGFIIGGGDGLDWHNKGITLLIFDSDNRASVLGFDVETKVRYWYIFDGEKRLSAKLSVYF